MPHKNEKFCFSKKRRSILSLTKDEARDFFLKEESYFNFELPPYFKFESLLRKLSDELDGKNLADFYENKNKVRDCDDVNHMLLNNKNGKYAWRPFSLIHPALYVSLAHAITTDAAWTTTLNRFKEFNKNDKIVCLSLPVEALSNKKDKAEQILHWWESIEQQSVELALDYEYIIHTDITDCYGSIYTHSIAWALHGKGEAKQNKQEKTFIGNIVDRHLQDMKNGQTNGIPQGSVLMDFIAEMVLGYADSELTEKINSDDLRSDEYYILRYRDDYRIFTHNPRVGERIVKLLTEVLSELGLKLNPLKTGASNRVIVSSLKPDKLHWINHKQYSKDIKEQLIIIHNFAEKFPNSGSLVKALTKFHHRLYKSNTHMEPNSRVLISIVADIALHNPRTYPLCCAIISELLDSIDDENQKLKLIEKIQRRFDRTPNTNHLDIWLQRITIKIDRKCEYNAALCKLVQGEAPVIWNSNWLNGKVKLILETENILNEEAIQNLSPVIPKAEVELFLNHYQDS